MAKARSRKSVGFLDDAVNFMDEAAQGVKDFFTPDKGTLVDKLQNRPEYVDEAVEAQSAPKPKPKPKPTTPQTKNKQLAADEKKSQQLSREQVEEIRRRLQAGEKVKTEEYE